MSRTLNDLIAATIGGGEEADASSATTIEVEEEVEKTASAIDLDGVEKLASALEFIGRRGVESFFEKEAMTTAASAPPDSGTNYSQSHGVHTQAQVAPHSGAPPMKEPGYGKIPNNEGQKPGGGSGAVDTSSQGKGDHHAALASNEAAINYDKKEKAKKVAPALSAVLDATPFADSKLKENLSGAGGKGDKNIHSKKAHDIAAVKAELARRVEGRA